MLVIGQGNFKSGEYCFSEFSVQSIINFNMFFEYAKGDQKIILPFIDVSLNWKLNLKVKQSLYIKFGVNDKFITLIFYFEWYFYN